MHSQCIVDNTYNAMLVFVSLLRGTSLSIIRDVLIITWQHCADLLCHIITLTITTYYYMYTTACNPLHCTSTVAQTLVGLTGILAYLWLSRQTDGGSAITNKKLCYYRGTTRGTCQILQLQNISLEN